MSRVEGSWLEFIAFDGVPYWEIGKLDPIKPIKTEDPLPSDCRFREDIVYLAMGDKNKSQE